MNVDIHAEIVNRISDLKNEPDWMRQFRLKALAEFEARPMLNRGGAMNIDFEDISYCRTSTDEPKQSMTGAKTPLEDEVAHGSLQEDLHDQGVIFTDTDTAVREHAELLREYFGTTVPPADNPFAALNGAVWSGGSFLYVPQGVHIEFPLQAYFRINAASMGEFERTLIIVDEGASMHYVEGCTSLTNMAGNLHCAVVEVIVKRNAQCRYTTIQNWASNVDNFVTQRAHVYGDATMQWVDGNLGSKRTRKHPAVHMIEPGARGEILSLSLSGAEQHQDIGAKLVHAAPNTSGQIVSKHISWNGGRISHREHVRVEPGARNIKCSLVCDGLILDQLSGIDTSPQIETLETNAQVRHKTNVSQIDEEQMFYLLSRGLTEAQALTMIINGFIEPFVKELPMEYAVEMKRVMQLHMQGNIG